MKLKPITLKSNHNNNRLLITWKLLLITTILLGCGSEKTNSLVSNTLFKNDDSLLNIESNLDSVSKNNFDSLKMHAFDDLYFGRNFDFKNYTINGITYGIKTTQGNEDGPFYFMILDKDSINNLNTAKKIVEGLKKTISLKYKGAVTENKTFFIEDPDDRNRDLDETLMLQIFKYDKKIIGLPFEFLAYRWNLKYKEIKIGYFIEHKNRTSYGLPPKEDIFKVYIQLTSKVLLAEESKKQNENSKRDSEKF